MTTRNKIIIDTLIGTPTVYVINVLARFLGWVLRIDHSLEKEFKTIVVSKYVGLGSIIQATPLLQSLRLKYPHARIIFVSTDSNGALLSLVPEINKIISISDKNLFSVIQSSIRLLITLWKLKPDLFIDLEFYSNYSSIITTLSKATNRLGFYKHDKPYRKGVYNNLVPFNVNHSISETYLQFAVLLKCGQLIRDLKISIPGDENYSSILEKTGLDCTEKYIVVNPNASDLRIERRWPGKSFQNLIKETCASFPAYTVVLIGNKTEAPYVNTLAVGLNACEDIVNTAGKLAVGELVFLLAHASLLITNDTGPMHIAFAVKTKTVSLFGPCSPTQYGGLQNTITFYKKTECSPCVHTYILPPCKGNNKCMKQISTSEVFNAVKEFLAS